MTEAPTGSEITTVYNEALAEQLLKIAKAKNKITTDSLASKLLFWALHTEEQLRNDSDGGLNPNTTQIKKDLLEVSDLSQQLIQKLKNTYVDAFMSLTQELGGESTSDSLVDICRGDGVLTDTLIALESLDKAAVSAARKQDGRYIKRGPHLLWNATRKQAVAEIGVLWWALTGSPPRRRTRNADHGDTGKAYGPWRDFVLITLRPLFGEDTERGIDAVLQAVVSGMKNNPSNYNSDFFHL